MIWYDVIRSTTPSVRWDPWMNCDPVGWWSTRSLLESSLLPLSSRDPSTTALRPGRGKTTATRTSASSVRWQPTARRRPRHKRSRSSWRTQLTRTTTSSSPSTTHPTFASMSQVTLTRVSGWWPSVVYMCVLDKEIYSVVYTLQCSQGYIGACLCNVFF